MCEFDSGGIEVHTVDGKTIRWIKDDGLRSSRQAVFEIDLVLTTTCDV